MSELTPHQYRALTTKGNLALTANAGSGKTFVLARKYLTVLLNENIDVSNIAAITFTEKAASELYSKISKLIDEQIEISTDNKEKEILERIRRQLVSANISTIHSFCLDILKQFPVEAQLDARFIPIDENLTNELIEISVDDLIRISFDDASVQNNLKYLIRIFGSKTRLASEISKLIMNRKNVLTVKESIYNKNADWIQNYFSEYFRNYYLIIWKKFENDFLKNLAKINSTVLDNDIKNQSANNIRTLLIKLDSEDEVTGIISIIQQIKLLAFNKDNSIKKRGYLKSVLSESVRNEIIVVENIFSDLIKFELPENEVEINKELANFGLILISFFDQALKIYEKKKKIEGFVDFEDILLHTKILLQNPDVQQSLSQKYKFIMVDEFQDTNEIQYQIFLPILDYLKKGELFIVGDEKQSIYKFRDAEIEIFNQTRENIRNKSGEENLLNLPDSFRMSPTICSFTNFVFKKLFSDPDEFFSEVPNTDLVCAREDKVQGKIEFLISRIDEPYETIEESELVANKILQIISEGIHSWKDIGILVRKRKNFDELEKSFLKNNIPYTIVGGRGFYQRQTISDVYNYLSFLADENNSIALVGILRSPFFTFSDSKIYEISLKQGSSFWRKLRSMAYENDELKKCVGILEDNIQLSNSIELPKLLKKFFSDENYLAIINSRIDAEQELANIEKLISIARNFNSKGFRNLFDFINYLKESIQGLEDEAQAAFSQEKEAVRLMTIHQSKGLEFPIVFLYKTSETGLSASLKSGQVQVNKKLGILAKLPLNNNFLEDYSVAPIISIHNFIEAKKNNAELKRLLYVAVTRAKDELYISASVEKDKVFNSDSFISLLSFGLGSDFQNTEIVIKDDLKYLYKDQNTFKTKTENLKTLIPITSETNPIPISVSKPQISSENFKFDLGEITTEEKGEIISASKVSIFSQCPLKYLLTYEYGFSKLNSEKLYVGKKNAKLKLDDIYIDEEEETDNLYDQQNSTPEFSAVDYGKLIHRILEKEVFPETYDDFIKTIQESGLESLNFNISDFEKLQNDLSHYFASSTYQRIKNYQNFKNEFEIYVKDKDHFLHGIIDKIVFENKKIAIFDYKTDDIEESDVEKRADYYLMQLKFYLYIAHKLFKEFDTFEGNLVFIKHPEHPVGVFYDNQKIKELEREIKTIINSIRQKKIEKNYSHCSVCAYSGFTKKCIIN